MSYIRGVWLDFSIIMFCRISELNANSVDSDQTPRFVAFEKASSEKSLHCLPLSFIGR